MTVTCNNSSCTLPDGATLRTALRSLSPYGDEPVAVLLNGVVTDSDADVPLADGDTLAVFPRLIGG